MEWDRVVPKTRAEARKAEENGFVFFHSIRSGFF